MKQSIGTTYLLNIIFIFIVIVFAFLSATLSYYKAYKVNTRILNAIEEYEGYNGNAQQEINQILGGIGYTRGNSSGCKSEKVKNGVKGILVSGDTLSSTTTGDIVYDTNLQAEQYDYCIYLYKDTTRTGTSNDSRYYYSYGVITYMHMNLPIVNQVIKIPVFTRTEKIYKFTTDDTD